MTRIGQNPAKLGTKSYQPLKLGIATVTYIPSQEGYFRDSLAILKLTLDSFVKNTSEPFDLLVFDNGSCVEIKNELAKLHQEGVIRWLVLSGENLGKTGAQNWIFSAMPNEWICYTDSDVLFRKGWLEASREIIRHFPSAGMVGAQPCFFDVLKGKGQAHLPLLSSDEYSLKSYMPKKSIIEEYCRGINAAPELAAKYNAGRLGMIQFKKDGFQAGLGASHMQFLIPSELARRIQPLPYLSGLSQEEDRQLDLRIDQTGALHLSTLKSYVVHMGNVMDDWVRELTSGAGVDLDHSDRIQMTKPKISSHRMYGLDWLAQHKWSRSWLLRLYNKLFQILSDQK
ncbi:MAG: glycosyltransferase family A protein [Anaerolineaceae bacterium]